MNSRSRAIFFLACGLFAIGLVSIGLADFTASVSSLSFGGVTFNAYEDDTESFTLTNSYFNVTLDLFVFDFVPNSSFTNPVTDNDFNITWPSGDISNMTLENLTTSASIPIKLTIPKGLNAIDENFNEVSFNVGDINISAIGTNLSLGPNFNTSISFIAIDIQVENNLEFHNNKIGIEVADDDPINISDGTTVDAFIGDAVEIVVRYENDFSNDSFEFNNHDIDAILYIDDDEIESENGEDDVEGGEVGELTFSFDLDDYDEDEYDVKIELTGTEENGGLHGEVFEFEFSLTEETAPAPGDADNDGVTDDLDLCPDTLILCDVDEAGCELDPDDDGICNGVDTTPDGEEEEEKEEEVEEDLESGAEEEEAEEEVEKEEVEDPEVSSWPFIFGLIVGVIGTALFFILTRI